MLQFLEEELFQRVACSLLSILAGLVPGMPREIARNECIQVIIEVILLRCESLESKALFEAVGALEALASKQDVEVQRALACCDAVNALQSVANMCHSVSMAHLSGTEEFAGARSNYPEAAAALSKMISKVLSRMIGDVVDYDFDNVD